MEKDVENTVDVSPHDPVNNSDNTLYFQVF